MEFRYIDSQEILVDSFRLGHKIYESGFIPTHAVSLWRGGTVIGYGIHQYFRKHGHFINHTTVATASYSGIESHSEVVIKGIEHLIDILSAEDRLLIIDDIFDSGRTIDAVVGEIRRRSRLNAPKQITVACIHKKVASRPINHNLIYLYDVPDGVWLSYPHEISELIGADDRGIPALRRKSAEIYDILNHNDMYPHSEAVAAEPYLRLDANELLLDSLRLAANIYNDGFVPDFLIAVWPNGVSVGLPVHEYFKYKIKSADPDGKTPDHISIDTAKTDMTGRYIIHGSKYIADHINYEDKVLLLTTDCGDGRLLAQTVDKLKYMLRNNIDESKIRTASVYVSADNNVRPDYWRKSVNKPVMLPQDWYQG